MRTDTLAGELEISLWMPRGPNGSVKSASGQRRPSVRIPVHAPGATSAATVPTGPCIPPIFPIDQADFEEFVMDAQTCPPSVQRDHG